MILMIDPPVNTWSTVDAVRHWLTELAAMREHYRDDPEALECIARQERYAGDLLELIPTLPTLPPPESSGSP